MRALVMLPLLLCAVLCVGQAKAEVKAVKLCGREFLRAVVYTCGGSRWRRFLLPGSEMDALLSSYVRRYFPKIQLGTVGLPASELSSLESVSSSSGGGGGSSSISSSSSSSSSPGSQLSRRDINNILTTVCCQVGCRKSDLTFLC